MPPAQFIHRKENSLSRGQRVLDGLGAGAWNWAKQEPEFATTESLEKCLWFNAARIP
jgi:hypothetical protein